MVPGPTNGMWMVFPTRMSEGFVGSLAKGEADVKTIGIMGAQGGNVPHEIGKRHDKNN